MISKKITSILVCSIVLSLVLVGQSLAVIKKENVKGVWLLDDAGTVAKDSSGNKNDGDIQGKPKSVPGKFGKALEFDGTNGVEIMDPEKFNFLTWTYTLWFRASAGGDYPNLIGRQFANTHGWTIHLDPGRATFRIRIDTDGGVNQVKMVPGIIADEEWHHGVITHDEKSKKLVFYYDGVKGESSYAGEYKNSGGFLKIAFAAVGAVNLRDAAIDEVAIFDSLLEEEDVVNIMTKGLGEVIPGIIAVSPEGSLAATWGQIKE